MKFEDASGPYLNKEGQPINFEKKRFQFWLENVPPDIRHIEYDFWQNYRTMVHARMHDEDRMKIMRGFHVFPAFDADSEEQYWQKFSKSFLTGGERLERMRAIEARALADLHIIFETHKEIDQGKVRLVALGGSSAYGPRKQDTLLSDVDLFFLLDSTTPEHNFDIRPREEEENKVPYHLIGTGTTDQARWAIEPVHWLLTPHIPLYNTYSDNELKQLMHGLVASTRSRKEKLMGELAHLRESVEVYREKRIKE